MIVTVWLHYEEVCFSNCRLDIRGGNIGDRQQLLCLA